MEKDKFELPMAPPEFNNVVDFDVNVDYHELIAKCLSYVHIN